MTAAPPKYTGIIVTEQRGDAMLIKLPQCFDYRVFAQLKRDVLDLLRTPRRLHVTFDFRRTARVDSAALGMLLFTRDEVVAHGGSVRVIGIDGTPAGALQLAGLLEEFVVAADAPAAANSGRRKRTGSR